MSVERDDTIATGGFDLRRLLVVLVRVMAVYWLAVGLWEWALVLDFEAGPRRFLDLPPPRQAVAVVFAVVDLVAAVGLWLLASWGAVVWLFLAVGEAALYGLFAEDFGFRPALLAFHAVTVLSYAVLTFVLERRS